MAGFNLYSTCGSYTIITTEHPDFPKPFMTYVTDYRDKTIYREEYKMKAEALSGHARIKEDVKNNPREYWLLTYQGESMDLRDICPL